jgi:thioredoxin-dependent peroxiredoxin
MTAQPAVRYVGRVREDAMHIHDKAPDFTLPDQDGNEVSLKDFQGKNVVLFFFPKADTPGWTIEARGFRDSYRKLQNTGAIILGVSADKPATQKKFKDKYDLPYTLLADTEKEVCEAYGVLKEKNMYGRKVMGIARTTFVIGPDGKIAHVFEKVTPDGHAEEVLVVLKELSKKWYRSTFLHSHGSSMIATHGGSRGNCWANC